jgi:glucose dehydrogenase
MAKSRCKHICLPSLVYNGKVVIGENSGDAGSRGLVRAFSETNGKLLWTFYTVPIDPIKSSTNQAAYHDSWGTNGTSGCTCSGGAVWNVPAVDPSTGIIYFGTGNPSPDSSPSDSARTPVYPCSVYTNLYTDCIIALNSKNGNMVWFFRKFLETDEIMTKVCRFCFLIPR